MNRKFIKKIAVIISTIAILMTLGVTAFAAVTSNGKGNGGNQIFRNYLTDEQKVQLTEDAKARLQQNLTDGRITQEQYDARLAAIEKGEMPFGGFGRGRRGMTEDQRAAVAAMQDKWNALTDEQKAEIYDINDQKAAMDNKIIDKYLEFGVIDSETAASLKENIETNKNDMRTNGRMPMGGGRGRGMRGNGCPFNGNNN